MRFLKGLSCIVLILCFILLTACKKDTSKLSNYESSDTNKVSIDNSQDDFFGDEFVEFEDTAGNTQTSTSSDGKKPESSKEQTASKENETMEYVNHNFKYLENSYSKLVAGETLNVTFIGGSITEGMGASSVDKTWANIICDRLQSKFGTMIAKNNKALGGTGSYFGAFRYTSEVAPKSDVQPDLLFIEFAINDHHNDFATYDAVVKHSESIVRKAYEQNPYVDIVYVLTLDLSTKSSNYDALKAHTAVAEKYGLLCIKLGDKFYQRLGKDGNDKALMPDGIHPNDAGYKIYADIIEEAIFADFPESGIAKAQMKKKTLPSAMSDYYKNPNMIYADKVDLSNLSGWTHSGNFSWIGDRYNGCVTATTVGSKFKFDFNGTHLGLLINRGKGGWGKIEVVIDGGEPVIIDAYRQNNDNPYALPIADLKSGKHTVEITLKDKAFQIGGILIN